MIVWIATLCPCVSFAALNAPLHAREHRKAPKVSLFVRMFRMFALTMAAPNPSP
jgi:hypothetical protein